MFGAFQWARAISDFEVLAADDPVRAWRGRMLDLFGGLARRAPAYGAEPMAPAMSGTVAIATVALILHALAGGGLGRRHVLRALGAAAGDGAARAGAAALLWSRVLGRFFAWVIAAIVLLLASGYGMIFGVFAGFRGVGLHVHLMQGIGIVMMLLFFHLYFAPWRRFRAAVARRDYPRPRASSIRSAGS